MEVGKTHRRFFDVDKVLENARVDLKALTDKRDALRKEKTELMLGSKLMQTLDWIGTTGAARVLAGWLTVILRPAEAPDIAVPAKLIVK